MARIGTGIMVILFWTGLTIGSAGASSDRSADVLPTLETAGQAASARAHDDAIEGWLADVAACEAGAQHRCAPVLR